jgi:hypothetical protein
MPECQFDITAVPGRIGGKDPYYFNDLDKQKMAPLMYISRVRVGATSDELFISFQMSSVKVLVVLRQYLMRIAEDHPPRWAYGLFRFRDW